MNVKKALGIVIWVACTVLAALAARYFVLYILPPDLH